jgi:hypothetical protein
MDALRGYSPERAAAFFSAVLSGRQMMLMDDRFVLQRAHYAAARGVPEAVTYIRMRGAAERTRRLPDSRSPSSRSAPAVAATRKRERDPVMRMLLGQR